MALDKMAPAYENFIDYLVAKASPQEILAYQASDEEQIRADELTAKNKAGILSTDEREELQQMLEGNDLVMLMKAKAFKALS